MSFSVLTIMYYLKNILASKLYVCCLVLAVLKEILRKVETACGSVNLGCSLLLIWLGHRESTSWLQAGLEPVTGGLNSGHVDLEAAVLAQQDHGCLLLGLVGGCAGVSDGHHVHDLGLAAHLDLLGGDLVWLQHHNDRVAGGLEHTRHQTRVTGDLSPPT